MGEGSIPAGRGIVPGQVAEIIVALDGGPGRRGSGYRVGPGAVLTAAHVIDGAASMRVRFDADLPGEWTAEVVSCWSDPRCDLAVLTIAPRSEGPAVAAARFGRIGGERAAVLPAQAVGFPRFKLKTDDSADVDADPSRYRDSHQADGSVAVLSNRREGTLELTVPPPERDPDPTVSPWEGMSGAAVWVGDRIVGVIAKHHRSDGPGRLATTRLDLALAGLGQQRQAELRTLLGLPDVLPDVVPRSTGEWVRSAYQAQVRDIAPDQLLDREAELDELVAFCAGDRPYAWWQAGPWAGKSALMSWFVLHPPAGVDVVSFFVTARLAGQSDSDACTNALIEQLAALIGESPAALLTAGARQGIMLRLLEDSASRAREAGRRLLLVIDGLDEDSGTATGPSIAALLPRRPPPEVRVLVASRPHPPLPDDVAGNHPLRTTSPRQLVVSEHARSVEHRAKHELKQLLAGEQLQREVLGLITAAGGGLTLGDLEELTQRPPFEIEHLLGGVFGRSVGSRTGNPSAGYSDERVYLFTHETLRLVAEQQYGSSLATYRDQLNAWADNYRQRKWPTETPYYLLRSYPRILAGIGDLPRLVACATDHARHDRMRDLTGGDAHAFTEISTAQDLIGKQPDPDLTSLALLAFQREHLMERNSKIPNELPEVWAILGQPTRADALANGIPDRDQRERALVRIAAVMADSGDPDRAEATICQITDLNRKVETLAKLAEVMIAGGDRDRAARLVDNAQTLTSQITDAFHQEWALARIAEVMAIGGGDDDRAARLVDDAEALTSQITDPLRRELALARIARATATSGDPDRAEALIGQITDLKRKVEALAELAGVVAAGGEHDRTTRLADDAETLTGQITDPLEREWPLARIAVAVAAGGDSDRAEALTGQISDAGIGEVAVDWVAQAMATAGDSDRAETLILQITDPDLKVEALAELAGVVAAGGEYDRTARLASDAEALTGQITDPHRRGSALAKLAKAAATARDSDRAVRLASDAEALTGQITDPHRRGSALAKLAKAAATAGDPDRAARLAGQIVDLGQRVRTLAGLAEVVAVGGDPDLAEVLTGQITHPDQRGEALTQVANAMAANGDFDRAETVIGHITHPDQRGETLAKLAMAATTAGDLDRAETVIGQIRDPHNREWALVGLVEAVAAGDDLDRAETLIGQITHADPLAKALARFARAVATGGDPDRAARLVNRIIHLDRREKALAGVAQAMAANGDFDQAEAFIAQISDPHNREWALVGLVEAVARGEDTGRAEMLIGQITHPHRRTEAEAKLAVAATAGDPDRAARLAGQITDLDRRELTLAQVAWAVAAKGDHDRAEAFTGQITDLHRREMALFNLVKATAVGGDPDRAARLATQIINQHRRELALAMLVQEVAVGGDPDRAARLAKPITHPALRENALALVAQVMAAKGDFDRAARLAGEITDPDRRSAALARLAKTLMDASKETSPIPKHASSSTPLMTRARKLVATALLTCSWMEVVDSLARVDPLAFTAFADVVQGRWRLDAATVPELIESADDLPSSQGEPLRRAYPQ